MPSAVATRYARALADVVLAPGAAAPPERVAADLRRFTGLFEESAELGNALVSPAVALARKRAVIHRLSGSLALSPVSRNFLMVLVDHRRTGILIEIIAAFEKLVDERLGLVRVEVETAQPLSEAGKSTLAQGLEAATGQKVIVKVSVNPDLIGGVVARIGSTLYDGSVRGRLEALARRLASN